MLRVLSWAASVPASAVCSAVQCSAVQCLTSNTMVQLKLHLDGTPRSLLCTMPRDDLTTLHTQFSFNFRARRTRAGKHDSLLQTIRVPGTLRRPTSGRIHDAVADVRALAPSLIPSVSSGHGEEVSAPRRERQHQIRWCQSALHYGILRKRSPTAVGAGLGWAGLKIGRHDQSPTYLAQQ